MINYASASHRGLIISNGRNIIYLCFEVVNIALRKCYPRGKMRQIRILNLETLYHFYALEISL